MKVYILTREPYHENSTICDAYTSLEAAEAAAGEPMRRDGYYVKKWGCVSEAVEDHDHYIPLVWERELL